ncbi:MAG: hypothetical protein IKA88_03655 [Clostridia bacterium]|nr:hypothetical protein [Clostridia bacterium]
MRKGLKRSLMALLCVPFALSMAACSNEDVFGGGGGGGETSSIKPVDETKAQLYVWNYDGGFGHDWLDAAVERYEEANKDKVWIEGTKGVQVFVDNQKQGAAALEARLSTMRNQVFFAENVNYMNWVYQGYVLDITDMVEAPISQYGETKSIADKLTDHQKNYYNMNGKYYALPHYEGINGLNYDRDLFDQRSLFFHENGQITEKENSQFLSAGVDGKKGTYDDGLPATYEQFYQLCAKLVEYGCVPMNWSGLYQFYFNSLLNSLVTDFLGDDALICYTYNGTTDKLIESITDDGKITYMPETKITEENGYLIYRHEGFYRALKFAETIINNNYYDPTSFNGTVAHTDAQDNFLLSRFDDAKDIAMLVEGSWWIQEADATFKMMEKTYLAAGRHDRKIGFMPFPKATAERAAEQNNKTYLRDDNYTLRFINANCDPAYIPLAKDFLQFCCTDESLVEYSKVTGGTMGYQYQVSEEDFEGLEYYAQSLITHRQNSTVIYPYSNTDFFYKNKSSIATFFQADGYNVASLEFKNNGRDAEEFFRATTRYFTEEEWKNMQ